MASENPINVLGCDEACRLQFQMHKDVRCMILGLPTDAMQGVVDDAKVDRTQVVVTGLNCQMKDDDEHMASIHRCPPRLMLSVLMNLP